MRAVFELDRQPVYDERLQPVPADDDLLAWVERLDADRADFQHQVRAHLRDRHSPYRA